VVGTVVSDETTLLARPVPDGGGGCVVNVCSALSAPLYLVRRI
jgi:hypothetical protein